jgi:hypothetical protein
MSHLPPTPAKPYLNPYLAGFGLGLVLLATFVVMGRGLGASGALTSTAAAMVNAVAPEHARGNPFYADYLGDGTVSPFKDWLVFQVIGVFVGGLLSGAFANRHRRHRRERSADLPDDALSSPLSAGPSSPSAPNSLSAA